MSSDLSILDFWSIHTHIADYSQPFFPTSLPRLILSLIQPLPTWFRRQFTARPPTLFPSLVVAHIERAKSPVRCGSDLEAIRKGFAQMELKRVFLLISKMLTKAARQFTSIVLPLVCTGLSETNQSILAIVRIILASKYEHHPNFVFTTPFSFTASAFPKTSVGVVVCTVVVEDGIMWMGGSVGWGRDSAVVDDLDCVFVSILIDPFCCSLGTIIDSSATSSVGCSITPAGTFAQMVLRHERPAEFRIAHPSQLLPPDLLTPIRLRIIRLSLISQHRNVSSINDRKTSPSHFRPSPNLLDTLFTPHQPPLRAFTISSGQVNLATFESEFWQSPYQDTYHFIESFFFRQQTKRRQTLVNMLKQREGQSINASDRQAGVLPKTEQTTSEEGEKSTLFPSLAEIIDWCASSLPQLGFQIAPHPLLPPSFTGAALVSPPPCLIMTINSLNLLSLAAIILHITESSDENVTSCLPLLLCINSTCILREIISSLGVLPLLPSTLTPVPFLSTTLLFSQILSSEARLIKNHSIVNLEAIEHFFIHLQLLRFF
ncbi:hypothetical protein BLNAU_9912 [Blattamonas nauphoetae]|uniref:Uncharacterized protein n=1 Tax=Blattamonas nauphoetae TaxID=2049346 RepID=A0ABQ9XUM4_9EUKA|nr:hypothetical protein BLNAU_9912 [Blattamonas nauphoetae]